MTELILETKNLTKTYGRQRAVDQVSLQVPKYSVYGLLGPNGAGKSTSLKILAGMVHRTSGTLLFEGQPWSRKDLAQIGALIESPPLYYNLSAWDNLKVRTLLLGLPTSRIQEVLDLVGLAETGKKKAGHFSMGMKQRLGLALALLNRPKLLILDEPTNGLDPLAIQDLRALIQTLAQEGMTLILSSHVLGEVQQMADHIGIISQGRLLYQGALDPQKDLEGLFMEVVQRRREDPGL
ncbi:MAG: lantibiotic protection ABC transporter ATP-binding protein [Tissierellia bacterium]|nr:lantibiotic protection ABC transporter ATP-binding protein [Tissierellia bacterium]